MNGKRLYQYTGQTRLITYRSYLVQEGDHCEVIQSDDFVSPVAEIADLNDSFQPPFRLRFGDRD